jgi:hypothetical protein
MRIQAVFILLHPELIEGVEGYNASYIGWCTKNPFRTQIYSEQR